MVRVRFAPSPTGTLHLGSALSAAANRTFADEHDGTLLLRIDDTDPTRTVEGGEEAILGDLEWLGIRWDEGPVRQSDRASRHREAAAQVAGAQEDADGALRFGKTTLLRADGTPTYQLASVVDDLDFGITHVIRGSGPTGTSSRSATARSRSPICATRGSRPRRRAPTSTSSGCRATTSIWTRPGSGGSPSRRSRR